MANWYKKFFTFAIGMIWFNFNVSFILNLKDNESQTDGMDCEIESCENCGTKSTAVKLLSDDGQALRKLRRIGSLRDRHVRSDHSPLNKLLEIFYHVVRKTQNLWTLKSYKDELSDFFFFIHDKKIEKSYLATNTLKLVYNKSETNSNRHFRNYFNPNFF